MKEWRQKKENEQQARKRGRRSRNVKGVKKQNSQGQVKVNKEVSYELVVVKEWVVKLRVSWLVT